MSVESRTEFQTSEILQDTMPSSTPLDTDGETLTHDSPPFTLAKIYRYLIGISKAVLGEATRRNNAKRIQGLEQVLTGSITSSSTAVTGSSTLFLTELYVGALIAGTAGEYREIAAIASDTSATLVVAFSSDIGSAQLFTRLQSLAERVDAIERYKNLAENGNLLGWVAGSSFSTPASDTQLADTFYANYDGSIGTFAITRNEFTLGQTEVPYEPQYYLRWNQTATGSGQATKRLRLKMAGVRSFAGQNMQVTFYSKMGSSTAVTVGATQYFGTGGSPSSDVVVTAKSRTLLTAFSRHTVTLIMPSITGKSLGSNNDDAVYVNFNLPLNATHDFYIASVAVYAGMAELPPSNVLTSGFRGYLQTALGLSALRNIVRTEKTSATQYSTTIPIDNTIPQSGEGSEIFTAAITPISAANYIRVRAVLQFTQDATAVSGIVAALFKDADANAICANQNYAGVGSNFDGQIVIDYRVLAGSTTARTYKIRMGSSTGNLFTVSGRASAGLFGGVNVSSITVSEELA